jgi:hypothetical protein
MLRNPRLTDSSKARIQRHIERLKILLQRQSWIEDTELRRGVNCGARIVQELRRKLHLAPTTRQCT